jgi:hypothetical protein
MTKFNSITFFLMFTLIFSQSAKAQDYADSTKVKKNIPMVNIKLRDGTKLKGKIIQNDGKNYVIQTENLGTLNIPAINVVSTEQVVNNAPLIGELIVPLRNTDYLLSQNGFNLSEGEWRYTNTYIYYNAFGVGISDNFSVGVGFIPIASIFTFSGKLSFEPSQKFHVALNGNYITSASRLTSISAGTLGAVATLGTNTKNLSIGASWGIGSGGNFTNKPIIQVSGISRISNKVAITMDNFLTTENRTTYNNNGQFFSTSNSNEIVGFLTYGVRILWVRSNLDVGLISILNRGSYYNEPYAFPYFKFSTNLTKRK